MSDEATIKRSLKIKTGSVKRLTKECSVYRKETTDLYAKAERVTNEGGDEWDVKNANNLVKETIRALDSTVEKLKDEVGGLRDLVDTVEKDERIASDESLTAAKEALKNAESLVDAESPEPK